MSRQNKDTRTRRFRFVISDDESHKQLWIRSLSRGRLALVLTTLIILVVTAFFCLIAFTPIRNFVPGYPDASTRREALNRAILIDSLERAVARWDLYAENLVRVVEGRDAIGTDSLARIVSTDSIGRAELDRMKESDSLLRAKVNAEEQFAVGGEGRNLTIEGMQFFTPLKGVVSRPYDRIMHPYLDLTAPEGSVVMAVLSGSVIDSYWSDESGYVTVIQHDNNIISIYKNNRQNLRKAGDKVSAGSPVALMGDHLHLEIWYKGEAVNPARYIKL
ncbi:MAG: M23 family metallopeptidase [Candidatus Cryptobacteroides sp.]|nr:M23 family metallopeptidase [Bacteroidales bacterium]MDY5744197.1 M23 family metallopeptidase [Candidatus Cryptobacteroides sp.]